MDDHFDICRAFEISKFDIAWLTCTTILCRERNGSIVECLTLDRGDAVLSLMGVTALCPGARHINV